MAHHLGNLATVLPPRPYGVHELARGRGFRASECVCGHGLRSRAFTGEHQHACVSVLLSGAFHVRTSRGALLAAPGALLLGNPADAYEFRHVDDGGDRSLVFQYDGALLEEAARALGPRIRAELPFRAAGLPPSPGLTNAAVLARQALLSGDEAALREAAMVVLGAALETGAGPQAGPVPSPSQLRAVARTVRHVEADVAGDLSLDALAAYAGLSAFHFVRVCRISTGQTPRQLVIAARLRAAAAALSVPGARVTDIALQAGFGDLSHFTLCFRRAFGAPPGAWRVRAPRLPRAQVEA